MSIENPQSELTPKSLGTDFTLTILTLGIWNLWVQIRQVDAVSQIIGERKFRPMIYIVFLSVMTFGLYFCYHEFKMTRILHKAKYGKSVLPIELLTGFIYFP